MNLTNDEINEKTGQIVDAAMKVHSFLGPGLLESSYAVCLAHELRKRGLAISTQYPISLSYDDLHVEDAYRADLVVENVVIVELKAVEKLAPIHEAPADFIPQIDGLPGRAVDQLSRAATERRYSPKGEQLLAVLSEPLRTRRSPR